MTSPQRRRAAIRRRVPMLLLATLLATASVAIGPSSAQAASASDVEAVVFASLNAERANAGLAPLRTDGDLTTISGTRATRMRDANVLSHTVAGTLSSQLAAYAVQWYGYGENIGYTSAAFGSSAAKSLHAMWMASPPHKALMLSQKFNYVGVGVAYRSSNGRTYASVVFSESTDHTTARARVVSATRSGDDITWAWTGYDPVLQTHTAGLRDFDVQYRIGSGIWTMLRNDSTSRGLTLKDRKGGRTYGLRVRATDRRGNVGPWTAESKIWMP